MGKVQCNANHADECLLWAVSYKIGFDPERRSSRFGSAPQREAKLLRERSLVAVRPCKRPPRHARIAAIRADRSKASSGKSCEPEGICVRTGDRASFHSDRKFLAKALLFLTPCSLRHLASGCATRLRDTCRGRHQIGRARRSVSLRSPPLGVRVSLRRCAPSRCRTGPRSWSRRYRHSRGSESARRNLEARPRSRRGCS